MIDARESFGGDWSQKKLKALKEYLESYTKALKNQDFELWYIDGFAGSGDQYNKEEDPQYEDSKEFFEGSPITALSIKEKPFDKFVFIDSKQECLDRLEERIKTQFPKEGRPIKYLCGDANDKLLEVFSEVVRYRKRRAVLFLDPFATQVKWQTVEKAANTRVIDVWWLFPAMAINRIMKKKVMRGPEEISEGQRKILNDTFGSADWRDHLYTERNDLFSTFAEKTPGGFRGIEKYIKERLTTIFSSEDFPGVCKKPLYLTNSRNSTLFMLFFACNGNRKAKRLALKLANHIIRKA